MQPDRRQLDRQAGRQTGRQADRVKCAYTGKQIDRHEYRQGIQNQDKTRQSDRQTC